VAQITQLDKLKVPLSGREIELQQVDYEGGGMGELRIRIRERTQFAIVDGDRLTAAHWGEALRQWAQRQSPGDG
jgi:hypothetical protein